MYFGHYIHQLDDKDRFRMPTKLREKLGEKIFITAGTSGKRGCLFVYSEKDFDFLNEKLKAVPMLSSPKALDPLRAIFSKTDDPEQDNQGRYKLQGFLKSWAGIDKNIVFATTGTRVEIWSEENWNKTNEEISLTPETLAGVLEELGKYGI